MTINSFKHSKWARRGAWAVGGVLALWALSWALVPFILKNQAEKLASEALGRTVTLGRVDFKPWTLEFEITDIQIASASASASASAALTPQLQIKRIYVDAALQSVVRLAPIVDAVQVEGLAVTLTHLGDGKYDIDDIVARLQKPSDQASSGPPKFGIFNIALSDGRLDFADQSVGKTHQLRDLSLAVPFLSNLDSQRDVKTEPRLAFVINGSRFDSTAQATPFTQTHKTDATFRLTSFDLKPYLGYVPTRIPVRLLAAVLDVDLKLAFEQSTKTEVKLTGTVQATGVKVADSQAQDLLSLDLLKVALDDVRPLEKVVQLSTIDMTAPTLDVRREPDGQLNLVPRTGKSIAIKKVAINDHSTGTTTTSDAELGGWKLGIAKLTVLGGTVNWTDQTTIPKAQLALRGLNLEALAIALPFQQPLQLSGAASLGEGAVTTATHAAALSFTGTASDRAAHVTVKLDDLPLAMGSPYLAQFLEPALSGNLSAELTVDWKAERLGGGAGAGEGARLNVKRLTLDNLALGKLPPGGKPTQSASPKVTAAALASVKKLEITDALVDLPLQSVTVGKLTVTQPITQVARDADKRWMYERWLKSAPTPTTAVTSPKAANSPSAPTKPWRVMLTDLAVDGGAVTYSDHAASDRATLKPVAFELSAIKLQAKALALDAKKPSPLTLSARIRAPQGEPGQLDYRGTVGLSPLTAQGNVVATQIPVHVFEPYFADVLNIELLRADAGFKGDVMFTAVDVVGPTVRVTGDVVVEEFQANTLPNALPGLPGATAETLTIGEELLNWKALSVRGLDLALAPGKATTVSVRETALTDFYARIIVNPSGQMNLQNLTKSAAPAPSEGSAGNFDATKIVANSSILTGTSGTKVSETTPTAPVINIGPISLVNGRVLFSDRFVKPNYTANLTELTGKLGGFSSAVATSAPAPVQMADLELRGRAAGTASLEILGKLNPLANPLALDIKAKVRDLELLPLSPYAVKYAGYGIERGKLSVDVAYVVKPDGQLEASNIIILNQLTFGDKVEGAENSLPVKLAVALLSDRNGVIDINLPISGSLSDPQFRLGPLIFKVIVNLIVKAMTAPFSLLASALGGGGDELGMVSFAPGVATLSAEAKAGLDKVAKALTDRPALKLTVVGTSNLEIEREAYKLARLDAMMAAEKRRMAVTGGAAPEAEASSAAERSALIKEVYKRADLTKPRNLVGMAKDIPVADMEALLLANIKVSEDAMRELALQRGVAVKDYLAQKQLPPERLFLGAEKGKAAPAGDAAPEGAANKWTPRAELNLAAS